MLDGRTCSIYSFGKNSVAFKQLLLIFDNFDNHFIGFVLDESLNRLIIFNHNPIRSGNSSHSFGKESRLNS